MNGESKIANQTTVAEQEQIALLERAYSGRGKWNQWVDDNPSGKAIFDGIIFDQEMSFEEFQFPRSTSFNNATFKKGAEFHKATFANGARFKGATFIGRVSFASINVGARMDFNGSTFNEIPDFHAATNPEQIALDLVKFSLPKPCGWFSRLVLLLTGLRDSNRPTMIRIRHLRGIVKKNHAIDAERELMILERNAQVGAAWSGFMKPGKFSAWLVCLSIMIFTTPLLLLYRWSSNYGRSAILPFLLLLISPSGWYWLYQTLYDSECHSGISPSSACVIGGTLADDVRKGALQDIAMAGALPIVTTLRSTYVSAIHTLFGETGSLSLLFQVAITVQNVISLTFLFLIGLALRNFFQLK